MKHKKLFVALIISFVLVLGVTSFFVIKNLFSKEDYVDLENSNPPIGDVIETPSQVLTLSSETTGVGKEDMFILSADYFSDDVAAFDISVKFDPSVIEITNIAKGSFSEPVSVSNEFYANATGSLTVVYVDPTGGQNPVCIDGSILAVSYKVLALRDTELTFGDVHIVEPLGNIKDDVTCINGGVKVE